MFDGFKKQGFKRVLKASLNFSANNFGIYKDHMIDVYSFKNIQNIKIPKW